MSSLLAALRVMKHPRLQALAGSPEIYKSGGNALAIKKVVALARQGDADALFSLGMLVEFGNCFVGKPDMQSARSLHREAAAKGCADAKARESP
jgi:TPR repeat protein